MLEACEARWDDHPGVFDTQGDVTVSFDLRASLERMLDQELTAARGVAVHVIKVAQQRGLPVAVGAIERQVTSLGSLPIEQLDRLGDQLCRRTTTTAGVGAGLLGFYGIFGLPFTIYVDLLKAIEVTSSLMFAYGFYPEDDNVELWLGLAAAVDAEPNAASARQVMLGRAASRVAGAAVTQARQMIVAQVLEHGARAAPAHSIPVVAVVTGGLKSARDIYLQGRRAKRYYRDSRLAAA
jgi:hypothetical protein